MSYAAYAHAHHTPLIHSLTALPHSPATDGRALLRSRARSLDIYSRRMTEAIARDAHGVIRSGFDFDLCSRNRSLAMSSQTKQQMKTRKTGTTICGCVFKGGIVLGADTRATEGEIICDKNCEKIHYIAPNIYCCGAGTSADTEAVTEMIGRQLELMRLQLGAQSRVVTAMTQLKRHLFKYQGQVSAALVLGGCDVTGPHLYTVYPHGSTDKLPFVSMGSGSLAAMAVLESGFADDMELDAARDLVRDAIRAGASLLID